MLYRRDTNHYSFYFLMKQILQCAWNFEIDTFPRALPISIRAHFTNYINKTVDYDFHFKIFKTGQHSQTFSVSNQRMIPLLSIANRLEVDYLCPAAEFLSLFLPGGGRNTCTKQTSHGFSLLLQNMK